VESFPKNGIQTRFVDGFKFIKCYSVDNLNNGIYPTLSSNGVVSSCTSSGSGDAGIWIAGSQNVTATDNEVYNSITVSREKFLLCYFIFILILNYTQTYHFYIRVSR